MLPRFSLPASSATFLVFGVLSCSLGAASTQRLASVGLAPSRIAASPSPRPTLKPSIPASPSTPKPIQEILVPAEVRPLSGQLDRVPLFNSNSPEWVKSNGILLSSFPPERKATPSAHLNYAFKGDFNLFAHHFSHTPKDQRTLYIGLLVHNPTRKAVQLDIPAAASYQLTEAPFATQPPMLENPEGKVFSGPGIRAVDTVLRGQRTREFPAQLVIPAGGYQMLMNQPIPVKGLVKQVNGRSTLVRLRSSDRLYVASLAMYAPQTPSGQERTPTLSEWQTLLTQGRLAGPRDKTPTPPAQTSGALIYGRVAGIQQGANWVTTLSDARGDARGNARGDSTLGSASLSLPKPGQTVAYALSTLRGGRLGTGQIQSGTLAARYPDTAYEAHGNYAIYYDLTLPLRNTSPKPQTVALRLASPLKEDSLSNAALRFRQPPLDFPFFRGTVRLRYTDDAGQARTRYIHLWHRIGQQVDPLVRLVLPPQGNRSVRLDFFYPPDSTPPQVLMVSTEGGGGNVGAGDRLNPKP